MATTLLRHSFAGTLLGLALASSAVLPAQTRTCRDSNAYCTKLVAGQPNSNEFAIEQLPDAKGKSIVGLSLYTAAVSNPASVAIAVYLGKPGSGPQGAPLATGTINVGMSTAWYQGRFTQPATVPANQTYYLAFSSVGIRHPRCTTTDAPLPYFWRMPVLPSWIGPQSSIEWAIREECSGGSPTAKISPFGAACPGTGITPTSRFSPNLPCDRPATYEWPVITAVEVPVSDKPYTIRRLGLPTVARGQPIRVTVRLLGADSQGRPSTPLTSVDINVSTTRGMHSAALAQPYTVPANAKVFLAYDAQGIDIPTCSLGAVRLPSYQFYSNGWLQGQLVAWSYLMEADGSPDALAILRGTGEARVGQTLNIEIEGARARAPLTLFVGGDNRRWAGQSLPIDLGLIGAPNCTLAVRPDVPVAGTAGNIGQQSWPFQLPNNPWLAGQRIYFQALAVDARANSVGITTTNGLDVYIGV